MCRLLFTPPTKVVQLYYRAPLHACAAHSRSFGRRAGPRCCRNAQPDKNGRYGSTRIEEQSRCKPDKWRSSVTGALASGLAGELAEWTGGRATSFLVARGVPAESPAPGDDANRPLTVSPGRTALGTCWEAPRYGGEVVLTCTSRPQAEKEQQQQRRRGGPAGRHGGPTHGTVTGGVSAVRAV